MKLEYRKKLYTTHKLGKCSIHSKKVFVFNICGLLCEDEYMYVVHKHKSLCVAFYGEHVCVCGVGVA